MAAGRSFRAPKGTRDLLVPESTRARRLVEVFADLAERSGFGLVVTPMFEELDVFLRLGEATDVVTKEMYTFETKGGDRLALRPELTASLVRAFVQHNPPTPWKAWCAGFNFRYERPQKGRYRQFEQVDVELIGTADPQADVEVVALGWRFYEALGLRRVALKLNDLGDRADRPRYLDALRAHFAGNLDALSEQSRLTLEKNPLRVLDSKRPEDADLVAAAPVIGDYVSDESAAAFVEVQVGLRALDVPFTVTPASCGGSTTTPAPRSSSPAWASVPARTRSAAVAATTGSSRTSGARRRPASASASASTAPCSLATRRACSRRRRRPWTCSSSTSSTAATPPCCATSAAAAASAPTGPTRAGA